MAVPRTELVRTEFFNDFMLPQRIHGLLNAVALVEEGRQSVVTLHGHRQFDEHDRVLYHCLTPHLQRAVQISIQLAGAKLKQAASVEVLNRVGEGVILVDADARVSFANIVAEKYFAARELRQSKGILRGSSVHETENLHAAIAKCGERGFGACSDGLVSLTRGPTKSPLTLLISPLPIAASANFLASLPAAIIFVNDPDKTSVPDTVQLRKKFRLTPAEAAFAVEILNGDGIQAAADRLSISRATARTHLSRIFDKTGVRRQAELVRLLSSIKLSP